MRVMSYLFVNECRFGSPSMLPAISEFYPPNPTNVPPQLTRPSPRYRLQTALVMVCLGVFVFLYLSLIALFGGFSWWALDIAFDMGSFEGHKAGAEGLG